MKYAETGFRAIYRQFTAFMLTDGISECLRDFPCAEEANCVLTYGYIDPAAGLTLEVLAAGLCTSEGYRFADGNDEVRSFIRMETADEISFEIFSGEEARADFSRRYAKKLEMLRYYDVSEEVERTREMGFLDASREKYYIDDVMVYLMRVDLQPEGCWMRISGLGEHYIIGTLLNEPQQDFGYHAGETIAFNVREEEGETICVSDLTPGRILTEKELEGGTLLAEAIRTLRAENTQENWFEVLELLRDSNVWVPCSAVLREEDRVSMEQMVQEAEASGGLDSLVGREITCHDEVHLVPELLQNGDALFFPVFSNPDEMGEFGSEYSKVEMPFLQAITLAKNTEKELLGIVVNAFTESFVLQADLFEVIETMKSRILPES